MLNVIMDDEKINPCITIFKGLLDNDDTGEFSGYLFQIESEIKKVTGKTISDIYEWLLVDEKYKQSFICAFHSFYGYKFISYKMVSRLIPIFDNQVSIYNNVFVIKDYNRGVFSFSISSFIECMRENHVLFKELLNSIGDLNEEQKAYK